MASCEHCDYDVCVVGAGLIGSSAARHLAEDNPNLKIVLIGPKEPKDRSLTDIHGAWHDQGRITRVIDSDPNWVLLAQRSINNYRLLEQKSGITFYEEVGYLVFGPPMGEVIKEVELSVQRFDQQVVHLSADNLRTKFPFLNTGPGVVGIFSSKDGGYINPREFVYAQHVVACQHGCDVIDGVVNEITSLGSTRWQLQLDGGRKVTSSKVLVAVGAFSQCRQLLPGNVQPKMDYHGATILLIEVEESDLPQYQNMPSLFTKVSVEPGVTIDGSTECGSWALPPIKYPDGKFYMKVGHSGQLCVILKTPAEIREWYIRGSNPAAQTWLKDVTTQLFPDLKMKNYKFDRCVTTFTHTGQLYVDMIEPSFGVALGGCGWAGKSADEIGYMAARMITKGAWDYDLPAHNFRFWPQASPSDH